MLNIKSGIVETSGDLSLATTKIGQIVETKTEKRINTMTLFVCVYDDNCVGIFRGEPYDKHVTTFYYGYGQVEKDISGIIFRDIFSEQVGIFCGYDAYLIGRNKEPVRYSSEYEKWQQAGYRIAGATATINMTEAVSFENVRSNLKSVGKIGEFNPGQATLSEIQEVLKLAPEYLGLTQEDPNKVKEKV